MVMSMKMTVFWDVVLYSTVVSQVFVNIYKTTQCNVLERNHLFFLLSFLEHCGTVVGVHASY
jgi:hypothetical protein